MQLTTDRLIELTQGINEGTFELYDDEIDCPGMTAGMIATAAEVAAKLTIMLEYGDDGLTAMTYRATNVEVTVRLVNSEPAP